MVVFDDWCDEICNSKAIADFATAGRHRGLSTISIKHNLFQQSKLGRHVELQNTHIALFKSPRDVMQVSTISVQLGLGSELVDWYRDTSSVSYGHLLVDLSPRTDNRSRYCTNTGSIPSKFYFPERPKRSKKLNTQSLWTLQVFQPLSHNCKNLFLQSCPKRVYPVYLRMPNKSAERKPAKHEKASHGRTSKRGSSIDSKTYRLEAKKGHASVREWLTAH